jgi:hypothetical protein
LPLVVREIFSRSRDVSQGTSRELHTPPSITTTPKDASTTHTIPPISPKHKAELSPGPVKLPIASSHPHSPKLRELPTTNTSPQFQSTSSTTKSSETISETDESRHEICIHSRNPCIPTTRCWQTCEGFGTGPRNFLCVGPFGVESALTFSH